MKEDMAYGATFGASTAKSVELGLSGL